MFARSFAALVLFASLIGTASAQTNEYGRLHQACERLVSLPLDCTISVAFMRLNGSFLRFYFVANNTVAYRKAEVKMDELVAEFRATYPQVYDAVHPQR